MCLLLQGFQIFSWARGVMIAFWNPRSKNQGFLSVRSLDKLAALDYWDILFGVTISWHNFHPPRRSWTREMEGVSSCALLLMQRLMDPAPVTSNHSNQTLRLANWGLCLVGSKALWEIRRHMRPTANSQKSLRSLEKEDINASNRNCRCKVMVQAVRRDVPEQGVINCQINDSDHWWYVTILKEPGLSLYLL